MMCKKHSAYKTQKIEFCPVAFGRRYNQSSHLLSFAENFGRNSLFCPQKKQCTTTKFSPFGLGRLRHGWGLRAYSQDLRVRCLYLIKTHKLLHRKITKDLRMSLSTIDNYKRYRYSMEIHCHFPKFVEENQDEKDMMHMICVHYYYHLKNIVVGRCTKQQE